jgi:hypothetical protein
MKIKIFLRTSNLINFIDKKNGYDICIEIFGVVKTYENLYFHDQGNKCRWKKG